MEQKHMDIGGKEWFLVRNRVLERGGVYKNTDGSMYLHAGKIPEIQREVSFIQDLINCRFPVPNIINHGEIDGMGYYIEQSVGEHSFGDKFDSEYFQFGSISPESFEGFGRVASQFLNSQLLNTKVASDNNLRSGLHLENVVVENPDLKDRILLSMGKIENELSHLPLVITHGDFAPRNVFPMGVIDFEHRFTGPVGYDLLTGVVIQRFWDFKGIDGKLQKQFDFSHSQIIDYLDRIDKVAQKFGINKLSDFFDQFILLKAIWSLAYEKQFAAQANSNVKWNFRRAVLMYCMDQYINNKPIDSSNFKNL